MLNYILFGILILAIVSFVFLFFFPIVQICGYSMFPTMSDGEFHLSRRVFRKSKCKIGEIYVFKPPYEGREEKFVIKRLKGIMMSRDGTPRYYFLGDNTDDSYDSRYYGYVDYHNVVAHIVLRKEV